MARWEPGAAERLQKAALELFTSQGSDHTPAAHSAAPAGLTQRTFFRYFGDKRDVLFHGQESFVQTFLSGVEAAPPGASPIELVRHALASGTALFANDRRPYSRMRQAVIDAHPGLQERERHKLAGLALALAAALRRKGVAEPSATLAAESGATVFAVAFAEWLRTDDERPLAVVTAEVLNKLLTLDAN
jgi:AcrR family transcriptional regulator